MAKKTMQPITKENSYGRRMVPEYLIEKLEKAPAKLVASGSIKDLTTNEINDLQAGDIVVKTTGDQKHTYIVTYKEEGQGICLSYFAAGYSETVSFDYVDGEWVYNSTDITNENLMEEIRDASGNLRFIEGEGTNAVITGLTINYNKWSLSGSHLMLVVAGVLDSNYDESVTKVISTFNDIPLWILNKINTVAGSLVEAKNTVLWGSDFSQVEKATNMQKTPQNTLTINIAPTTSNRDRNFRIQYDLLIDNE